MVSRHVVIFDNDCNCITVHHDLRAIPLQNVILDKVDHDNTLCHEHISDNVDGGPPLLVYSIHGIPNCFLELKFTLNGLQEEKHFTMRQSHFPGKYCNETFLLFSFCPYELLELRPTALQRITSMRSASLQTEGRHFIINVKFVASCVCCYFRCRLLSNK